MSNHTADVPRGTPGPIDHPKPDDGVPSTPGGTPWVPGSPPTGNPGPNPGPPLHPDLPGRFGVLQRIIEALVSNPSFNPKNGLDESLFNLAEQLTDRIMQHYPKP